MSVLVVEDEVFVAMFIEELLAELGFGQVTSVHDIEAAIRAAETSDFKLAILDLNLSGASATSVVRILRQRDIPFVITTGHHAEELPEAIRGELVLFKPYGAEEFRRAVRKLVSRAEDSGRDRQPT